MTEQSAFPTEHSDFSEEEIKGLYKTIFNRRDVRGQFKPTPIPDDVLSRVLYAAHHAPSVGFMQPWSFILIRSAEVKFQVHQLFQKANKEAAEQFDDKKSQAYKKLKLEGILESPLNICITCDRDRAGPVVLGRTHIKTMDIYSTVCAVQNLWLAARSEGLGLGWVSIMENDSLQEVLGIPKNIVPIAYLCIGYVDEFLDKPELEKLNWRKRLPLEELVYFDQWENKKNANEEPIINAIKENRHFPSQF